MSRPSGADVTREPDVERLFARAAGSVGSEHLDHVLVTAADLAYQPIREFDVAAARRAMDSKILELWDVIGGDKAATFAAMAQRLPGGRIGTADDLGHAAVFLMENEFTTGAVLTVDGGHRFV